MYQNFLCTYLCIYLNKDIDRFKYIFFRDLQHEDGIERPLNKYILSNCFFKNNEYLLNSSIKEVLVSF